MRVNLYVIKKYTLNFYILIIIIYYVEKLLKKYEKEPTFVLFIVENNILFGN